jgi:C-terminal peptidase prc
VALFLFFLQKSFLPGISSGSLSHKSLDVLRTVVQLIKNDYVEEKNPSETMEGAFKGMINSLDVLSAYLSKDSLVQYPQQRDSKWKEIGVILFKRYGLFPQVIGIVENSPAEKKGIKIGDYLSSLENRSTLMMSLVETKFYLRSQEEKPIKIKILRENKTLELDVERKSIYDEPLSFSQEKGISGILKIYSLYPPCTSDFRKKFLLKLKFQTAPLVLDLRNCSEGDLQEAPKLINFFLKADSIGYFEKKEGTKDLVSCKENAELSSLPLVIWVNQATLGASELVAGVLQDFKKAKIIGVPTIGVVAKQELFPLKDGSALLLSIGVFALNSGRTLWGQGVKPDVKLELEDQSFPTYLKKTLDLISTK